MNTICICRMCPLNFAWYRNTRMKYKYVSTRLQTTVKINGKYKNTLYNQRTNYKSKIYVGKSYSIIQKYKRNTKIQQRCEKSL